MSGAAGPRVVVAGGGPAGLEGVLALRRLLPEARVRLVAPDREFVHRPYAFSDAFGLPRPRPLPLPLLAEMAGCELRRSAVTSVMPEARRVSLASGESIGFDALIVATGARRIEGLPGATTFWGTDGDPALARVLDGVRRYDGHVTFAVPPGVAWSLPIYELALATAAWCRREDLRTRLRLLTGEQRPVALLGGGASARMADALAAAEIEWRMVPPWEPIAAAEGAIISMPRLRGRGLPGLPLDEDGFLRVDESGRVRDVPAVYAAGDVTSEPIKQGGLSAQQADAAASAVAVDLAGLGEPQRFDAASALSWWPAARILGRHLAAAVARLQPA